MARRGGAIEVEQRDDVLTVRAKGRTLTLKNAVQAQDDEDGADFVVLLDDIQFWDAPDDAAPIEIDELPKIMDAIEDFAERRGVSIAFE